MALRDKLSSLATTVGGRANNAIENGKLNLKINSEEKKIAEYTLHIGELLVERLDNGETFGDEVAALYHAILASRDVIASARADIEENKQEIEAMKQAAAEIPVDPVCPACGALLRPEDNFCSQCGAKVEVDPAPPTAEPAAAEPAAEEPAAPEAEPVVPVEETPAPQTETE